MLSKIANSYAEPAYARPRIKTDLSYTKVTLVFCVGLRPTFCSFILNLNQAEQKKLRVKFLFVMCCVFAQTRVCRLKSEDPHHGLDSNYVEVVLGCDKNILNWNLCDAKKHHKGFSLICVQILFIIFQTSLKLTPESLQPNWVQAWAELGNMKFKNANTSLRPGIQIKR